MPIGWRTVLVFVAGGLALGEVASWLSYRRLASGGDVVTGRQAVVVLGFANPGERANAVNRWRVRAALRSVTGDNVLVCCGGPVRGPRSEASILAAYARDLGYSGEILLDEASRTTYENVVNAVALVGDAGRIVLVSDPHHVEKATLYLRQVRPDLAERLTRGAIYRPGEFVLAKPLVAAHGLFDLARARRRLARSRIPG